MVLLVRKVRFSRFWCPKDFEHYVGYDVCVDCGIKPVKCRVKANLVGV